MILKLQTLVHWFQKPWPDKKEKRYLIETDYIKYECTEEALPYWKAYFNPEEYTITEIEKDE